MVVVEGRADPAPTDAEALRRYDEKYDWQYDVAGYGDLLVVHPLTVLAWRSAGYAGRDGFRETGRWTFEAPGQGLASG